MEKIRLELLERNPYQTRSGVDPEHIEALAEDIWKNGLLQVPVGRRVGERVQLAFGHNRLEAYRKNKGLDREAYSEMPVEIRLLSDEQMALLAWSENEKRQQLTPLERAKAIKRMMESFSWTQQDLADKLDMARSTLANLLRLLNLPFTLQKRLNDGLLSQRQAMALLPVYELSDSDLSWVVDDPGRSEWLQQAWGGMIDSDTIRVRVSEYLQALEDTKPKQMELQEEPEEIKGMIVEVDDCGDIIGIETIYETAGDTLVVEADPDERLREQTRALIQPAIRYLSDRRYLSNATELQRQFRINYTAAMRLIDELQKWDVLGEREEHGYPVLVGKYAPKVEPGGDAANAADLVQDVSENKLPGQNLPNIKPMPVPAPIPVEKPGREEPAGLTVEITWSRAKAFVMVARNIGKTRNSVGRSYDSLLLGDVPQMLEMIIPEPWKEMIK